MPASKRFAHEHEGAGVNLIKHLIISLDPDVPQDHINQHLPPFITPSTLPNVQTNPAPLQILESPRTTPNKTSPNCDSIPALNRDRAMQKQMINTLACHWCFNYKCAISSQFCWVSSIEGLHPHRFPWNLVQTNSWNLVRTYSWNHQIPPSCRLANPPSSGGSPYFNDGKFATENV